MSWLWSQEVAEQSNAKSHQAIKVSSEVHVYDFSFA